MALVCAAFAPIRYCEWSDNRLDPPPGRSLSNFLMRPRAVVIRHHVIRRRAIRRSVCRQARNIKVDRAAYSLPTRPTPTDATGMVNVSFALILCELPLSPPA